MTSASMTIDAGVLSVPPQDGTAEDVHRYVEKLLDWAKLLNEPWVAIYMSERASDVLQSDGLYPLHDQLKRLFAANNIFQYSVNDVTAVVNKLLQLTPHFETYFKIKDVLTEDLLTEPDILRLCSGTELQSDLARCVVLIAILRQHCREFVNDHSLVLNRAHSKTIRVRALIHDLEHDRSDIATLPAPPEYFEGDVLVCDNFRGLIDSLDAAAILLRATDDIGVETSIRIAICKVRMGEESSPNWDDVPAHRIGHEFLASFRKCNLTLSLANKLLRAIVETLDQVNMAATHTIRTGLGGDDLQRVRERDQAKAWRRDIDRKHHLHYWTCIDGPVEIASVSFPHDDFTIPE